MINILCDAKNGGRIQSLLLLFHCFWALTLSAQNNQVDEYHEKSPVELSNIMIDEIDFKNADLKDIIRLLATRYGLNMFVEDNINVKITMHLANISLLDVLIFISQENNLIINKYGRIYKIMAPPALELPAKKWNIEYENGLLSLDFLNEDIQEALYQISKLTGITILFDKSVQGNISGLINRLPFKLGLVSILNNSGYSVVNEANVYRVKKLNLSISGSPGFKDKFWINVHDGLIDIEASVVPLKDVLRVLSDQLNLNVFFCGDIQGSVNVSARNLELGKCLKLILGANNYAYKLEDGIYLIGEDQNKMLLSSKLLKLKHLKVDRILEMLPPRPKEKTECVIIKEHNAILVTGSSESIAEIEDLMSRLDRPVPQILFEALVVDYNYQDIKEISLQAGLKGSGNDTTRNPGDGWFPELDIHLTGKNVNDYLNRFGGSFGIARIGKLPDDFYLKVKALETVGKANIRSKPQIATLNGYPADITIGQTQYYILKTQTPIKDLSQLYIQESQQFHTIEANITLKITPWVSASGEITVEIHPEFNSPIGALSSEVPPTIQRRALNSTVRLQNGETIILGGLIQTMDADNITQIPILGNLPLIGRLFQNKNHTVSKSELIIYITPHLSYGNEIFLEG